MPLIESHHLDGRLLPSEYDRVDWSNIPNTAAALLGFLVCLADRKDAVSSPCGTLLNPSCRKNITHYSGKYALLSPKDKMQELFQARLTKKFPNEELIPIQFNYIHFTRLPGRAPNFGTLFSRKQLEHWFFSHFFKLAQPFPRQSKQ
ncbi:hypothetical protein BDY21DRAFT_360651 [Lineolata rhizophorae]|uniref:Uncharacterized protein n=1 Tax=Lineolata rhizophorae TaxID=578093 RepID=A0A6A6PDR6_9PEZI|nr:hypothetical protein BDY21DRAFT_360651 [Lineolata rhizophorae]